MPPIAGKHSAQWALDDVLIGINDSSRTGFHDKFDGTSPLRHNWFRVVGGEVTVDCLSLDTALIFHSDLEYSKSALITKSNCILNSCNQGNYKIFPFDSTWITKSGHWTIPFYTYFNKPNLTLLKPLRYQTMFLNTSHKMWNLLNKPKLIKLISLLWLFQHLCKSNNMKCQEIQLRKLDYRNWCG